MEKIGKRFQGKVVIVTASTQGIGFAIALRLGLEGASLVISSRKQITVSGPQQMLMLMQTRMAMSVAICQPCMRGSTTLIIGRVHWITLRTNRC